MGTTSGVLARLVAALVFFSPLAPQAHADAPAFRGDPAHSGIYATEKVPSLDRLAWKFKTGGKVVSSPAVSGGTVYVGSADRVVYALNAADGAVRWRYKTAGAVNSSPAVAGDTVFVASADGNLYAVDARTGAGKWAHDNKKGWVIASPAVERGVVYFPTSDGERFKALDAATGDTIYDISNKAVSFSSPAIARDTVFYGSSDSWLHAVDASTGRVKAEFQTDGSKANAARFIDPAGHIDSAALYPNFTLDGMIIGLDRMFSLGSVLSSPVVVDGVVYFGSTDGNVYAIR